jgi:hypothetical protein
MSVIERFTYPLHAYLANGQYSDLFYRRVSSLAALAPGTTPQKTSMKKAERFALGESRELPGPSDRSFARTLTVNPHT